MTEFGPLIANSIVLTGVVYAGSLLVLQYLTVPLIDPIMRDPNKLGKKNATKGDAYNENIIHPVLGRDDREKLLRRTDFNYDGGEHPAVSALTVDPVVHLNKQTYPYRPHNRAPLSALNVTA